MISLDKFTPGWMAGSLLGHLEWKLSDNFTKTLHKHPRALVLASHAFGIFGGHVLLMLMIREKLDILVKTSHPVIPYMFGHKRCLFSQGKGVEKIKEAYTPEKFPNSKLLVFASRVGNSYSQEEFLGTGMCHISEVLDLPILILKMCFGTKTFILESFRGPMRKHEGFDPEDLAKRLSSIKTPYVVDKSDQTHHTRVPKNIPLDEIKFCQEKGYHPRNRINFKVDWVSYDDVFKDFDNSVKAWGTAAIILIVFTVFVLIFIFIAVGISINHLN